MAFELGENFTWFMRVPNSLILKARKAINEGEMIDTNDAGAFNWPAVGDTMTLRRVYVADRRTVGDVTVRIREIHVDGDLVACARVKFDTTMTLILSLEPMLKA